MCFKSKTRVDRKYIKFTLKMNLYFFLPQVTFLKGIN